MNLDEKHSAVKEVLEQVISIAKPDFVFMYNCKYDWDGDLTSFKLCVVCDFADKRSCCRRFLMWTAMFHSIFFSTPASSSES